MSPPSLEQLRRLGASLREIDPTALQDDPDEGRVRWFLGEQGTELFAWAKEGEAPHHLQMVLARVSIEWSDQRPLVTGTFEPDVATYGGRSDPYLLQVGSRADPAVCQAALTALEAARIDPAVLKPFLEALVAVVRPPEGSPVSAP